jgi:hypothetical protein
MEDNYIEQDKQWTNIANKAWEARKLRIAYEKQEKELFDILRTLSSNKPSKAGGFIFNYTECKGIIDYMSIPGIKELNLDPYRKEPIIIWKLEKD